MLNDLTLYESPVESFWKGRKDTLPNERFFQVVHMFDLRKTPLTFPKNKRVFIGFCSDEGIRRNEGRLGAKTGPIALRQQLAKLPYHGHEAFLDLGNINCFNQDLEKAQQELANLVAYCHQEQQKTVIFGGGHEIAWGHFLGLTPHYPKLGIINFDAHFDLRPLPANQQGTSGTPFQQIAEYSRKNDLAFSYCCLGIQPHANTKSLFTQAEYLNVSYLTAQQINELTLQQQLHFLDHFLQQHEAIYLSICLDVFAESHAPGVSAPQALGLHPWQVLPLLNHIIKYAHVVSFDVAELSPPLDQHQQTARLAATLIAELLEI